MHILLGIHACAAFTTTTLQPRRHGAFSVMRKAAPRAARLMTMQQHVQMERTFIMVKPDGVDRGLTGEVGSQNGTLGRILNGHPTPTHTLALKHKHAYARARTHTRPPSSDSVTRTHTHSHVQIIQRFERRGLHVVALRMRWASDEILKEHYHHIAYKSFFPR